MTDHDVERHDDTRYWRFDPCGECDDPNCAEGDSVNVSDEIATMSALLYEGARLDITSSRWPEWRHEASEATK